MVKNTDIEWAWEQAATVRGKNNGLYRRDEMGNEIYKPSNGKNGEKSWHIDHRNPVANGGTDHRRNLRVLQAEANIRKSDNT